MGNLAAAGDDGTLLKVVGGNDLGALPSATSDFVATFGFQGLQPSGHSQRKLAAAPTNVCFEERGQADWREVDWQVWADHVEGHMSVPFREVIFAGLPAP